MISYNQPKEMILCSAENAVYTIQFVRTLTWLRMRSWAIRILERSSGVYSTASALALSAQTEHHDWQ